MRDFIDYMKNEKRKAENTLIAYERDLTAFEKYLTGRGAKGLEDCTDNDAIAYVLQLSNENKSKPTINRKVSALRTYYEYLPLDDVKGLRDKALLEFMYGTGARVTEVVRLRFSDVNLRMNFVTLRDVNDESRIVPLGSYASAAMAEYINNSYDHIKGRPHNDDDFVFINFRGDPLTRQGIWKILKDYGQMLGIESRMTPQILRDSFAVHILQNGGDLKTLQELMGFEDMTVGIAYLAVIDIRVREVFRSCHPRA